MIPSWYRAVSKPLARCYQLGTKLAPNWKQVVTNLLPSWYQFHSYQLKQTCYQLGAILVTMWWQVGTSCLAVWHRLGANFLLACKNLLTAWYFLGTKLVPRLGQLASFLAPTLSLAAAKLVANLHQLATDFYKLIPNWPKLVLSWH